MLTSGATGACIRAGLRVSGMVSGVFPPFVSAFISFMIAGVTVQC